MITTSYELAPHIFKLRTDLPDDGEGFTFNQFLIRADEPLLFHTGPKALFPSVLDAVSAVMDVTDLRWIVAGHFEDDECGALNLWQQAAPHARCASLALLAQTSLNGFAEKPVTIVGENEAMLDLGSHRVKLFATPHFTHAWEAQMLYEEVTQTLFTGDFGAQIGMPPMASDLSAIDVAMRTEELFKSTNVSPLTIATIKRLQAMDIQNLAIMHGASLTRQVPEALARLHDFYKGVLEQNYAEMIAAGS